MIPDLIVTRRTSTPTPAGWHVEFTSRYEISHDWMRYNVRVIAPDGSSPWSREGGAEPVGSVRALIMQVTQDRARYSQRRKAEYALLALDAAMEDAKALFLTDQEEPREWWIVHQNNGGSIRAMMLKRRIRWRGRGDERKFDGPYPTYRDAVLAANLLPLEYGVPFGVRMIEGRTFSPGYALQWEDAGVATL